MGKRSRRAENAEIGTAIKQQVAHTVAFKPVGVSGRTASRRQRGTGSRPVRLSVALSEQEATQLRQRACALGISVSRLLVESALEMSRVAAAPKTRHAPAADWCGTDTSTSLLLVESTRDHYGHKAAEARFETAIFEEIADHLGNRPPWLVGVMPDEGGAIHAGPRVHQAWECLARTIARLRLKRQVVDMADHGLDPADRAVWRDLKELAYAISVPGYLDANAVRLPGERQFRRPTRTAGG